MQWAWAVVAQSGGRVGLVVGLAVRTVARGGKGVGAEGGQQLSPSYPCRQRRRVGPRPLCLSAQCASFCARACPLSSLQVAAAVAQLIMRTRVAAARAVPLSLAGMSFRVR